MVQQISIFVDNLQVRLTPACSEPIGLMASGVHIIQLLLTGQLQQETISMFWITLQQIRQVQAQHYQEKRINSSSLNPGTTYYFHVRTVCAGPTYSIWSTVSFTTLETPPANNDCSGAQVLTLGALFGDNDEAVTLVGATNSNPPDPGCASFFRE